MERSVPCLSWPGCEFARGDEARIMHLSVFGIDGFAYIDAAHSRMDH
jgi:hypothetical protein